MLIPFDVLLEDFDRQTQSQLRRVYEHVLITECVHRQAKQLTEKESQQCVNYS